MRRVLFALAVSSLVWLPTLPAPAAGPAWRWREVRPASGPAPEARRNGAAVFDAAGDRLVLFGGSGASGLLNDTWAYERRTGRWTRLETLGAPPAPRLGHDAVYDPVGRRMVVWAGQRPGAFFDDTWALDLATLRWTELSPPQRPPARYGSASVFDPVRSQLVTFGGFTTSGRFNDTQAFSPDGRTWTELSPSGTRPGVRCLHTAALHAETRSLLVYGGQQSGPLGDLWSFDLATGAWTELRPTSPPAGRYFASSFVDARGRLVVFGGATSSGNVDETWAFDLHAGAWERLDLESPPAARNGSLAAYVPHEDRFLVFGGSGASGLLGDLWELGAEVPAAETWILPSAARSAGARGAFYTTSLTVSNTGSLEATYTLKLLGHDQDGRDGAERTLTLAAGHTATHADLLALLGVDEGYGAVLLTATTPDLAVLSETSTPGESGGTFGQSVPAVRVSPAGESSPLFRAARVSGTIAAGAARSIPGVREDAAYRTNLVLANASEGPLDVDVRLVSPLGEEIGRRTVSLPPLGMTQLTRVASLLGASPVTGARLVLRPATPEGRLAAYAALVDNVTNDPRTLLPQ